MSKARLRLWLQVLKLSSHIEAELRRRLRDRHGTTLPRFDVMAALARHPEGLKMSKLSDYLRVSNGNVTGIVDRLTEEGLALREAVPGDRRAQVARLSDMGHAVFADIAAQHETWIDELLGGLSGEEIDALSKLINRAHPEGDAE
jgi:DNA-binding MarR family transcriptional regulator